MDAQLVVIVAGIILAIAIIGSLFFLRGYSGKFTFDTSTGTRPRAAEGGQYPRGCDEGQVPASYDGGRRRFHGGYRQAVEHADGLFRPL